MDTYVTSPRAVTETGMPGGIADILMKQVQQRTQSPAVFFQDKMLTYGDLGTRAKGMTVALIEAGITFGDKVGILFPNHPDFVASFFGVLSLGATVVPINPLLKADEIEHILFDSGARAVIVHEDTIKELAACIDKLEECKHVFVIAGTKDSGIQIEANERRQVTRLDDEALQKNCKTSNTQARQVIDNGISIAEEHLAVLVYTSGTTGKPKGAMLTHGNLVAACNMKRSVIKFGAHDRVLAVLPLCHIYGLGVVMLGMVAQGGAMVIVERFEPKLVLTAIQNNKVSIIPAVPAMYQFMALELSQNSYDISSLRYGLCGAAPIEAELLKKLDAVFGIPILEGYALTETACIATITPPAGPRKLGSVGPKVPGVEVAIVDAKVRPLPPGKGNIGQIAVKGPNVMVGYYKQPEATAECMKDGWFLTGDLGYYDTDGYIYICGRNKELIIRGGQNVYPREVESVISRIEGVLECAVVGLPDKYMGERVKAVVVMRPGASISEDDVKDYCSEHLASYKVPRVVEFRDLLPRNSTGKVLKRLLV